MDQQGHKTPAMRDLLTFYPRHAPETQSTSKEPSNACDRLTRYFFEYLLFGKRRVETALRPKMALVSVGNVLAIPWSDKSG